MANPVEDANILPDVFVIALSRYRNSKVLYYTYLGKKRITFDTYKKTTSTANQESDTYGIVPPGMDYRPDLVSQKVYGDPNFWWKILEANNIKDIFDFKAGLNLRFPGNVF